MSNSRTIELILRARNLVSGPVAAARSAVGGFLDGTVGSARRALGAVLNLRTAIAGFAGIKLGQFVLNPTIERAEWEGQLRALLGSAEAARAKLQEIEEVALSEGVDQGALVGATTKLQNMTKGALATKDALILVADAAAGTTSSSGALDGQIQMVADNVGRLYAAMKEGAPINRALMPLTQAGVVSYATAEALEAMTEAGAPMGEMWARVEGDLRRFAGAAKALDVTAFGQLQVTSRAALAELGETLLPVVNAETERLIEEIQELRDNGQLAQWGRETGEAITATLAKLRETAAWIAQHKDSLMHLGLSLVAARIAYQLVVAISALRAAMIAQAAATAAAAAAHDSAAAAATRQAGAVGLLSTRVNTLAGALSAVPLAVAVGVTFYQLGKSIGDSKFGEWLAAQMQSNASRAKEANAGLPSVDQLPAEQQRRMRLGALANAAANEQAGISAAVGSELTEFFAGMDAKSAAMADREKETQTKREAAAKQVESAVNQELRRRENLAHLEDQMARDSRELLRATIIEAWDSAIETLDKALADAEIEVTLADESVKKAEDRLGDAVRRAKMTPDERRAERDAQRDAAKDERRLAAARRAQAEGLPVTRQGKALIAADDARQARDNALMQKAQAIANVDAAKAAADAGRATKEAGQEQFARQDKVAARDELLAKMKQARAGGDPALAGLNDDELRARLAQAEAVGKPAGMGTAEAMAMLGGPGGGAVGAGQVAIAQVQATQAVAGAISDGNNQLLAKLDELKQTIADKASW